MTQIVLEQEPSLGLANPFVGLAKLCLFACVFFIATVVLFWTVENKFAKIQKLEPSKVTAEMRMKQLECLARNIYHEAGGEPFEGKVAVAQVTINRMESGLFPGDLCKVVYEKNVVYGKVLCQFSWYCNRPSGLKPINNSVYEESMSVAKKVLLEGFRLPSLTEALYFHADYVNPGWKKQRIAKIGRHIFYK